jgi:hypothetical protein
MCIYFCDRFLSINGTLFEFNGILEGKMEFSILTESYKNVGGARQGLLLVKDKTEHGGQQTHMRQNYSVH